MTNILNQRATQTKEQLEIAKLQLDIRYVRRNFFLQLINTLLLITIAALGFYFVQRPQIDHLAASRAAAERQHIDVSIAAYLNMKDPNDKRNYFAHLKSQYAHYPFFSTVQESIASVTNEPDFKSNTSLQSRCSELDRLLAHLYISQASLRVRLDEETRAGHPVEGRLRPLGRGPVARLIETQIQDVDERMSKLGADRKSLGCPQT